MQRSFLIITTLFIHMLIPAVSWAAPGAEILSFESRIKVNDSGDIEVIESYTLHATRGSIRVPFFRRFPTRPDLSPEQAIHLRILSVTKDGKDVPYELQYPKGSVLLTLGSKGTVLEEKPHIIELRYRVSDQVHFFESHDELYARVIPGFHVPILKARVEFSLPEDIPADSVRLRAYFKRSEASTDDFILDQLLGNRWLFTLQEPLEASEEFNVVIGWPKGFVIERAEPVFEHHVSFEQSLLFSVFALGCVGLFIFYGTSHALYGSWKRPRKGPVQADVPRGLMPLELRYVWKTAYDGISFSCLVVQLAVKGYLRIIQEHRSYGAFAMDTIQIRRNVLNANEALHPLEREVYEGLFEEGEVMELGPESKDRIQALSKKVDEYCQKNHIGYTFVRNQSLFMYGFVFNILVMGATIVAGVVEQKGVLVIEPLYVPFALLCVAYLLFCFLIKGRSYLDKKLMVAIVGYRRFLLEGTQDEASDVHTYEKHLAYALALDCTEDWVHRFNKQFDSGYHASWYEIHGELHERHEPDAFLHTFPQVFSYLGNSA